MQTKVHSNPPTVSYLKGKLSIKMPTRKVSPSDLQNIYGSIQSFGHLIPSDKTLSFSELASSIEQSTSSDDKVAKSAMEQLRSFEASVPEKKVSQKSDNLYIREIELDSRDYRSLTEQSLEMLRSEFPKISVAAMHPLDRHSIKRFSELNILVEENDLYSFNDLISSFNAVKSREPKHIHHNYIPHKPARELFIQLSDGNTGISDEDLDQIERSPTNGTQKSGFKINIHTATSRSFRFAYQYHRAAKLVSLLQPGLNKACLKIDSEGLKYRLGTKFFLLTQEFPYMMEFLKLDTHLPSEVLLDNDKLFSFASISPFINIEEMKRSVQSLPKQNINRKMHLEYVRWINRYPEHSIPEANETIAPMQLLRSVFKFFPNLADNLLAFEANAKSMPDLPKDYQDALKRVNTIKKQTPVQQMLSSSTTFQDADSVRRLDSKRYPVEQEQLNDFAPRARPRSRG